MSESKEMKPVVYEIAYGTIKIKLDKILNERNITTYALSDKTNIKFQTIQSLRQNSSSRIDFEVLAKICYALDCKVEDIIEYIPNLNKE